MKPTYPPSMVSEQGLAVLLRHGYTHPQRDIKRDARVLWLRYCADSLSSYAAIGRELGVTRERIRQLEAESLRRLRNRRRLPGCDPEGLFLGHVIGLHSRLWVALFGPPEGRSA